MANNDDKWLIAGLAGLFIGAWWKSAQYERDTMSQAEIDAPDMLNDIRAETTELLEDLEITEHIDSEGEFHTILSEYLDEYSEYEIEITPDTPHGKPDILIGGLLALEIKYNPTKTEFDRLIGQCVRYSREWDTWIIVVDSPKSKVRDFIQLLRDKGLDYLPVLSYKT